MNFLTFFRKLVPATTAMMIPLFFVSCAGMSAQQYAASQAIDRAERKGAIARGSQQKFQNDQRKTVTQGTAGGAILGALAGGIIGHQQGNAGAGALIGGLAGGLAGNAFGQGVANKKAAAVVVDVNLDVYIQEARSANRSAKATVRSLRGQLSSLKSQVARARASGDRAALSSAKSQLRIMQSQASSEEKSLDSAISRGSRQLNKAGTKHPQFDSLSNDLGEATETRGQVESTKREIASLLNQI